MNTEEKIKVMQAYVDGHPIEYAFNSPNANFRAFEMGCTPSWNWSTYQYRIALTEDSINWDDVSDEYLFMARDEDGDAWLYTTRPRINAIRGDWTTNDPYLQPVIASAFKSYKRGTVGWRDSLVKRPLCGIPQNAK